MAIVFFERLDLPALKSY